MANVTIQHKRLLIFHRMEIDLTHHPSRCVCVYVSITSSPFSEMQQRIYLHHFICVCFFYHRTFFFLTTCNKSTSSPLSLLFFISLFFLFRRVRNLGMFCPVSCFFVVFFTVNFIKRSSVAAEAHKRGCRVISFLTFKHFQLN